MPSGHEAVASWMITGEYGDVSVLALRPPRLVVYPAGEVVADAAYRSSLPVQDVADLVQRLTADLSAPEANRREKNADVMDAGTTVLTVRSAKGTFTVKAYALDEVRDDGVYPGVVYDARDRLGTMRQRVVSAGQPYTAERVRLIVTSGASPGAEASPWPASVAMPSPTGEHYIRQADLEGQPARDVVHLLARDLDLNGAWQTYRTADGQTVRASWRYLLPDE